MKAKNINFQTARSLNYYLAADSNAEKSLITPSEEAREPLLAASAENGDGKAPVSQAGLELSRRGVKITAFGPNPDGDGIVLRLWEMAGQSGKCQVRLPTGLNGLDVQ
jgi:alpha-mannosidase